MFKKSHYLNEKTIKEILNTVGNHSRTIENLKNEVSTSAKKINELEQEIKLLLSYGNVPEYPIAYLNNSIRCPVCEEICGNLKEEILDSKTGIVNSLRVRASCSKECGWKSRPILIKPTNDFTNIWCSYYNKNFKEETKKETKPDLEERIETIKYNLRRILEEKGKKYFKENSIYNHIWFCHRDAPQLDSYFYEIKGLLEKIKDIVKL